VAETPFNRINWVDVLAVILLFRMGYIGLQLGLGSELVKLTGLVGGFFVSFRYYQGVGDLMAQRTFLRPEWAAALAMVLLLALTYFAVTRVLRLMEPLVQVSFEKRLSQAGGLVVGLGRGILVTSVVLVLCQQLPSPYMQESITQHSLTGGAVSRAAPALYHTLRALLRRRPTPKADPA